MQNEKAISALSDETHKEVLASQKKMLETTLKMLKATQDANAAQNLVDYLNCNRGKVVCDKLYVDAARKIKDSQEEKNKTQDHLNKSDR